MKRNPKTAFGIQEDGLTIKLAYLVRDAYQLYLLDLHRVDLDKPLYGAQTQFTEFEQQPKLDLQSQGSEIQMSEYEQDFSQGMGSSPWDTLFNSVYLDRGVIAVNVNEDQITREANIPKNKKEEMKLLRSRMTARQIKAGEWQSSKVDFAGSLQYWLHIGMNQLLELLKLFSKTSKRRLYYQLADANDIALADYYRIYHLAEEQRVLLLYLGYEYRKAFLFDQGNLVDVYSLNISEPIPEPDLILSRVNLALDNVQQADPELTVLCGDLATENLVNHFLANGHGNTVLLSYPQLAVDSSKADTYDTAYMAQFAMPIALAYKALFTDESRFTPSNFMPKSIIEAQKPFRIVWHGFMMLFIVFSVTLVGTMDYLYLNQRQGHAIREKKKLEHQLARLKIDAQDLERMRNEMAQFSQNLDAVRLVLQGKNPWSEVLDTLNRLFQAKPISWLTNFKLENSRLMITGITTNRANVIDFAEALPDSRILKVTNQRIHNHQVWNFEISSSLPQVDWVGQIEAEMQEILEQGKLEAERRALEESEEQEIEEQEQVNPGKNVKQEKPAKPEKQVVKKVTAPSSIKLAPIAAKYMPVPTDWQNKAPGEVRSDYDAFLAAANAGNLARTKELGYRYLDKYEGGRLIPLVRWHLANQLYLSGDYTNAIEVLDPIVHYVDEHYPYGVLLAARIDIARNKQRHSRLYDELLNKYPNHPVRGQVDADLAIIGNGGDQ